MNKPLIVLSGPTAVGKTALSINLAKSVSGEIISADSMQVYKGMDIGTAKIKEEEMCGVRHHLIDIISPFDEWNVMEFKNRAVTAIDEIYGRGNIPIVTGGTGFYIQALLKDVDFEDEQDNSVRTSLENEAKEKGSEYLYKELCRIDPVSAEKIHCNNVKRVIRAIEFYRLNGYPFSEHNETQMERTSPYDYHYFVLTDDREKLYKKIEKRVDIMLEDGLVEEVQKLKNFGLDKTYVSMQGLGYKEILDYLDGNTTLEEAVYLLKRDTRHFAKRQMTWFRREKDVDFVDKSTFASEDEILKYMISRITKFNLSHEVDLKL